VAEVSKAGVLYAEPDSQKLPKVVAHIIK